MNIIRAKSNTVVTLENKESAIPPAESASNISNGNTELKNVAIKALALET